MTVEGIMNRILKKNKDRHSGSRIYLCFGACHGAECTVCTRTGNYTAST